MTILEMIEKLETEIVSLQARCESLAASVDRSQSNGNARLEKSAKAPAGRKPAARKTRPPSKQAANRSRPKKKATSPKPAAEQLELPVPAESSLEEQQSRALGKRLALGKSLVDLRKMSAWRAHRAPEEEQQ